MIWAGDGKCIRPFALSCLYSSPRCLVGTLKYFTRLFHIRSTSYKLDAFFNTSYSSYLSYHSCVCFLIACRPPPPPANFTYPTCPPQHPSTSRPSNPSNTDTRPKQAIKSASASKAGKQTYSSTRRNQSLSSYPAPRVTAYLVPQLITNSSRVTQAQLHVVFSATSRISVRDFYAAALRAGGKPSKQPAYQNSADGAFSATVFDLDGHSIQVIFSGDDETGEGEGNMAYSRVLSWRSAVDDRYGDLESDDETISPVYIHGSVLSDRQARESGRSVRLSGVARSYSEAALPLPASKPEAGPRPADISSTTSTLLGTLLGAAAGAGVAYAMFKAEDDGARSEAAFVTEMEARRAERKARELRERLVSGRRMRGGPVRSLTESHLSVQHAGGGFKQSVYARVETEWVPSELETVVDESDDGRPQPLYSQSYVSASPSSTRTRRLIEYRPAPSTAASRRTQSTHRTTSSPLPLTLPAPRAQKLLEPAYPTTSHRSRSRSRTSTSSRHSTSTIRTGPTAVPLPPSRAAAAASVPLPASEPSASRRSARVRARDRAADGVADVDDIEVESLAPCDSISCVGSTSSRRSRRSSGGGRSGSGYERAVREAVLVRPRSDGVSEAGSERTVGAGSGATVRASRRGERGSGSVVTLPVRLGGGRGKSVVSAARSLF